MRSPLWVLGIFFVAVTSATVLDEISAANRPSLCYLEKVTGPCMALFWKYAYVKELDRCEKFIYGGCEGNLNSFWSYEECQATCGGGEPLEARSRRDTNDEFVDSPPEGDTCVPGTCWRKDCNYCRCTVNGISVCTRNRCVRGLGQPPPEDEDCIPGTRWMDDCNTCRCTSGNYRMCTKMYCGPPPIICLTETVGARDTNSGFIDPPPEDEDCVPGTRWKVACNLCFCSNTYARPCTRYGCL